MKRAAPTVLLLITAALSLTACGKSDSANEAASAENVEMPAEEAMSTVDAAATPVADGAATGTATATDAATGAATDAAAPVSDAAEKATADAEKKM